MENDALIAKLYALGWTTGGVAYQPERGLAWQVQVTQVQKQIIALAPSQIEAWSAALLVAESGNGTEATAERNP